MADGDGSGYREVNLRNWESRVAIHERDYGLERFREDPQHLSNVVRFDLPRLGDVAGRDAVHLQCHIGTDTMSLARLGARVTGLDFSASALEVARRLAADCDADIEYVESDVYDAVEMLSPGRFDLVYTGIGALCWLPDVRRWAQVVHDLLRPGGRLFIREVHPMLWALSDPRPDGLAVVDHPYFETATGTRFQVMTTYTSDDRELSSPETIEWNHGLAETITAVMDAGLRLDRIEEHDSVPYPALGPAMELLPNGEYRLRDQPECLAATYTLEATKP